MRPSLGRIILVPFHRGVLSPAIVLAVHPDGGTVDCLAFQLKAVVPVTHLPPGIDQVEGVPGIVAGWVWPPKVTT